MSYLGPNINKSKAKQILKKGILISYLDQTSSNTKQTKSSSKPARERGSNNTKQSPSWEPRNNRKQHPRKHKQQPPQKNINNNNFNNSKSNNSNYDNHNYDDNSDINDDNSD